MAASPLHYFYKETSSMADQCIELKGESQEKSSKTRGSRESFKVNSNIDEREKEV
jgi:hypothetical protein